MLLEPNFVAALAFMILTFVGMPFVKFRSIEEKKNNDRHLVYNGEYDWSEFNEIQMNAERKFLGCKDKVISNSGNAKHVKTKENVIERGAC